MTFLRSGIASGQSTEYRRFFVHSDQHYIEMERNAPIVFRDFVRANKELLSVVAGWGDGRCGYLLSILQDELLTPSAPKVKAISRKKKIIGPKLRLEVYKRDGYRCVSCGTSDSLSLDHIIPESKGGCSSIDNLQTMCVSCNSKKGAR